MTSTNIITQQSTGIHYPNLSARERELQLKNENLQRYVTELLTRNATLNAEIRKLEGVRR